MTTAMMLAMLRVVIRWTVVSATAEKHANKAEERRKQIYEAKFETVQPSDLAG
jgi:hypothetical protein